MPSWVEKSRLESPSDVQHSSPGTSKHCVQQSTGAQRPAHAKAPPFTPWQGLQASAEPEPGSFARCMAGDCRHGQSSVHAFPLDYEFATRWPRSGPLFCSAAAISLGAFASHAVDIHIHCLSSPVLPLAQNLRQPALQHFSALTCPAPASEVAFALQHPVHTHRLNACLVYGHSTPRFCTTNRLPRDISPTHPPRIERTPRTY